MMIHVTPANGEAELSPEQIEKAWSLLIENSGPIRDMKVAFGDDWDNGWQRVRCPSCQQIVDPYWYVTVSTEANRHYKFSTTELVSPCCQANVLLSKFQQEESKSLKGIVFSFESAGVEKDTQVLQSLQEAISSTVSIYYSER